MDPITQHPDDATLRCALDGEISTDEQIALQNHLSTCIMCQKRQRTLQQRAYRIQANLNSLSSHIQKPGSDSRHAYHLFQNRNKEIPLMKKIIHSPAWRTAFAVLTVVAVLSVALSFPSVRALASSFLGLFRIEQVEVVSLNETDFSSLDSTLSEKIGQLFSDSMVTTREAITPVESTNQQDASDIAGFQVRLPKDRRDMPLSQLSVEGGSAFEMTVDLERAQEIVDLAGRDELVLPEALAGAKINVDIPVGAIASLGDCMNGDNEREFPTEDCYFLMQVPSPSVTTDADVDPAQIAEIGLRFLGMSNEEAQELSRTIDWQNTLVIPIVVDKSTYTDVTVDGVNGKVIRSGDTAHDYEYSTFTIVWVKDGIVYSLSGRGDEELALTLANELE